MNTLPAWVVTLGGAVAACLTGLAVGVAGPVYPLALGAGAVLVFVLIQAAARLAVSISLLEVMLASSLVIVTLPAILPGNAFRAATVLVLVGAILFRTRPVRVPTTLIPLALLLALMALSLFRGALIGVWGSLIGAVSVSATMFAIAFFVWIALTDAETERERDRHLRALAMAPGVFAAVNLLLYAGTSVGIIPTFGEPTGIAAGMPATMLQALGFGSAERTQLPLTAGVTTIGDISAVGLVLAIFLVRATTGTERIIHVLLGVACLVADLMSDARTPLAVAFVLLMLAAVAPRMRAAKGIAILLPLSPVIFAASLGWAANSQLSDSLSRDGDDFATGTGRTYIWEAIWDHALSSPAVVHLVGYGANGQVTSGSSAIYAHIFEAKEGVYTAHNVYLQLILDIGYLGLFVFLWVCYGALDRLFRGRASLSPALGWSLLLLMLTGIVGASITPYSVEVLTLFIMLVVASAAVASWDAATRASERGRPALPPVSPPSRETPSAVRRPLSRRRSLRRRRASMRPTLLLLKAAQRVRAFNGRATPQHAS